MQQSQLPASTSATPHIPEHQRQLAEEGLTIEERDPKTGKRRIFPLGKQRAQEENIGESAPRNMDATAAAAAPMMPSTQASVQAMRPASPFKQDLKSTGAQPIPISPSRNPYPNTMVAAASPSRLRSSSPRMSSPASSEIFERNVQEPVPISTLQNELSPAHIPTHVLTEDHIPPALEASAEAITSEKLNPDEVEIVTATSHQPAAASVLEGSTSHADLTSLNSPAPPSLLQQASEGSEPGSLAQASGFLPPPGMLAEEEGTGSYGALDPNDVRRLSFISFADVVQSEHQHPAPASQLAEVGSRDSLHIGSIPNLHERAGSPLRSPRSVSSGVVTPPLGSSNMDPIAINTDQSPVRSTVGSPVAGAATAGGHSELTIETMRQAVRKTASGDLSGVRSAGMSPVASSVGDEGSLRQSRSRTNT